MTPPSAPAGSPPSARPEPPSANQTALAAICTRKLGGNPCGIALKPCEFLPGYLEHTVAPRVPHYAQPLKSS